MPEHVLYSYPADRQYNFYSKEYLGVYLLVSENYTYLFTTEKPAGCDQVLQLTAFNGTTQTAAIKHTNTPADVTDSNVQFEVSADISGLTLKPDEIYTIAIINKPRKTVAQFDTNIDSTTTEVADNAKFDMQKTSHSAEGDMEILEQTEIYSAHFRTSSYKTFSEKMGKMTVGGANLWQEKPFVNEINSTILENNTAVVENLDFAEYSNSEYDTKIVHFEPIYEQTPWYYNNVEPWLYGNKDLQKVTGKIEPPKKDGVVVYYRNNVGEISLNDNIIETNGRLGISMWNSIINYLEHYIDDDLYNYQTYIANKIARDSDRSTGVKEFMAVDNIPKTEHGNYPVKAKYILPGKTIKTSEYQINLNY